MTEAEAESPEEQVAAEKAAPEKPQRDANGLFQKGNQIGKGHHPRGVMWTSTLRKAATQERIKAIIERAFKTAETHQDWRAAAEARIWIFRYLTPAIEAEAKASEQELAARPLEERIVTLSERMIAHAEQLGTPEAAAMALRGIESAVKALVAARGSGIDKPKEGDLDLSKLSPEKLAALTALVDEARKKSGPPEGKPP